MSTWHTLFHIVRADFWERVRRYSFLVVLGLTLLGGYLLVPPTDATYVVGIHPHDVTTNTHFRGLYNSAWVGSTVAAMTSWMLSLLGFYVVKDAVERDRRTGVGEIIATTPLSKPLYVLGKWLSNMAVVGVMVGAITLASLVMQLVRGEDMRVELGTLLAPFLWIVLPPLILVAALAVLFETIPGLRDGFGNWVYAVAWLVLMPFSFEPLSGLNLIESSVLATLRGLFPDADLHASLGINPAWYQYEQTFHWEGVQWTVEIVLPRLAWVGVAVGAVLLAALFFDRFDPTRGLFHRLGLSRERTLQRLARRRRPARRAARPSAAPVDRVVPTPRQIALTPLVSPGRCFGFGRMLLAELRLMLKGRRWWWYAVALGLIAVGLLCPLDAGREFILPAAWIWPLLIWSAMGTQEVRHRTEELVFSTAHPLRRQLPATWLAGVVVALLTGSGVAVRLVLAGEGPDIFAWAVGALFIPSLALALGCWTGNGRFFELVYTVIWYVGPVNQLVILDYMGVAGGSVPLGTCRVGRPPLGYDRPLIYLLCTIVLLGLAVIGRRRQL